MMGNQTIKCVVWDLDNTIWEGVLLEEGEVALKPEVVKVIKELDRRGILQSISSKNAFDAAEKMLVEFGLWEYFIYPQINWNAKSDSITEIARNINIGIDTIAFVDDQPFEREEVRFSLPDVLCIDALDVGAMLTMDRLMPKHITEDSIRRRGMYQSDIRRNEAEKEFVGTKVEFLHTLGIVMKIAGAKEEDLKRAEELTVRTHQLNSTGTVYSYNELKECIESDKYLVLIAQLDDAFGQYGKIGLAVVEKKNKVWELKLLLASCRVMSKGVGNVLMNYVINEAIENNVSLRARFVPTDRNRIMYITYKFNGFNEIKKCDDACMDDNEIEFEADLSYHRSMPEYVKLMCEG